MCVRLYHSNFYIVSKFIMKVVPNNKLPDLKQPLNFYLLDSKSSSFPNILM